jgi:hypothetical protein
MKTIIPTLSLILSLFAGFSLQAANDGHFDKVRGNAEDAVYTIFMDATDLEIGDEVAIFDGSTLVGSTVIVSDNPFDNFIAVFATRNEGRGYQAGNEISMRVWRSAESKEVKDVPFIFEAVTPEAHTAITFPEGDAAYSLAALKSLDKASPQATLRMYPNPANHVVTLLSDVNISKVEVFSSMGQLVMAYEHNEEQMQLDISALRQGVYVVRTTVEGEFITQRLVVR